MVLTETSFSEVLCTQLKPLLKPTLKQYQKRENNVQINFNSFAIASLYELLCYYSLEHFDSNKDEFHTFNYSTLSSPYSSRAISTVLPEAKDGNVNEF